MIYDGEILQHSLASIGPKKSPAITFQVRYMGPEGQKDAEAVVWLTTKSIKSGFTLRQLERIGWSEDMGFGVFESDKFNGSKCKVVIEQNGKYEKVTLFALLPKPDVSALDALLSSGGKKKTSVAPPQAQEQTAPTEEGDEDDGIPF